MCVCQRFLKKYFLTFFFWRFVFWLVIYFHWWCSQCSLMFPFCFFHSQTCLFSLGYFNFWMKMQKETRLKCANVNLCIAVLLTSCFEFLILRTENKKFVAAFEFLWKWQVNHFFWIIGMTNFWIASLKFNLKVNLKNASKFINNFTKK